MAVQKKRFAIEKALIEKRFRFLSHFFPYILLIRKKRLLNQLKKKKRLRLPIYLIEKAYRS